MRGLPSWILALCILVAMCAIGVSIIYSFHGFKEGFASDGNLDDTLYTGEEQQQTPSNTDANQVASLHEGMDQNIAGSTAPLAYSASNNSVNTTQFQNLLQAIQQRIGNSGNVPTDTNLSMASDGSKDASGVWQGKGSSKGVDASGSDVYVPNQETIYPHQRPPAQPPRLTATVPTDAGTQAEAIQTNQILTPSMRQMIRSDVKSAIKEEVNDIQNQYEITYEQM